MQLAIVVDQRYWQTPDGAVWTRMPPARSFFEQNLELFDSVRVIARVAQVLEPPERAIRADGPGITFWPVESYIGPVEFLSQTTRVLQTLRAGIRSVDAVLMRVPSNLANCIHPEGRPYAVEVLGDPAELYARGASRAMLRPLYRRWFVSRLRRQCRKAVTAAYVSHALAQRYPSRSQHLLLDIDLPEEAFAAQPRQLRENGPFKIVTAGGFDHPVKGHDVLIEAVSLLRQSGLAARLAIVGDGRLRKELALLARRRNVPLEFVGQLPGSSEVRLTLQSADLFALASRTEGKPRSLIEARALGLPAVATSVGGIPEVLPPEQLVPSDSPIGLADAIRDTLRDPERYARLSVQGIDAARQYGRSTQRELRRAFLMELKSAVAGRRTPAQRSAHGVA